MLCRLQYVLFCLTDKYVARLDVLDQDQRSTKRARLDVLDQAKVYQMKKYSPVRRDGVGSKNRLHVQLSVREQWLHFSRIVYVTHTSVITSNRNQKYGGESLAASVATLGHSDEVVMVVMMVHGNTPPAHNIQCHTPAIAVDAIVEMLVALLLRLLLRLLKLQLRLLCHHTITP